MKNNDIKKTDYTEKYFNELTDNEITELFHICVISVKEKMLNEISNVPMMDRLLQNEYNDLISQAYIYAYAKNEKYPQYNAFQIVWYAMYESYRKLLNETIGKLQRKRIDGKEIAIGRHTNESLDNDSNMIMKTKTEKQYDSTDYIELKIDIENTLNDFEKTIVKYRQEGYTYREIAIIKNTNAMKVNRTMKEVQKKLIAYKSEIIIKTGEKKSPLLFFEKIKISNYH